MRRIGVSFVAVFLLLFVAISLSKLRSPESDLEEETAQLSAGERERVLRFWEIYREATEHRTAGRIEEAAEAYVRSLELNDTHEDALYYLGNMRVELGQFGAAERAWRRLLAVNPASARAHSRLGVLYSCLERPELIDLQKAEAEFKRAFELNKEETGPLLRLGQIALVRGDLETALHYLDAVIGSNYSSVEAHFLKGYVVWKQGDHREASELFAQALRYARPAEPVEGVLGEGDTQTGSKKTTATSSNCRTMEAFTDDLTEFDDADLVKEAELRYRELDRSLPSTIPAQR